jgi:hydroxymethylbilane synthase
MSKDKSVSKVSPLGDRGIIRIGTRDSALALWQAHLVQKQLQELGCKTQIVSIKSDGDLKLDQPLYELGITGIFTKTLDVALLNGTIDIAVHSMKDVPTALPQGIVQVAVLERANEKDILLHKGNLDFLNGNGTIATGSLRRQAMWLNKYPNHQVVDLRGNVNTRMQKLQDNDWNGAVFAAAGLERINLKPDNFIDLNWMVPAPAQGAMVIHVMQNNEFCKEAVAELNDLETDICTYIERQFLRTLEGGCTAPIGALTTFNEDEISFKGILLSIDGTQKIEVNKVVPIQEWKKLGFYSAQEILNNGGKELMKSIKDSLKK